jgi:uncharacterized membrane protein YcaP (DUF421 family)
METVVRITFVYLMLMLFFRVIGKRELSQMSSFELVTLMIIPEIVAQSMVREDFSLTNAVIGVSTLFGLVIATSILTHKFRHFAEFTEGKPTVLVHNGRLIEEALNLERIQPEEIFSEMHQVGLEELQQVKWAILEPDGKISIIPHPQHRKQSPSEDQPLH